MSSSEKADVKVSVAASGQKREQVIVGVAFFVPVVLAMAGWFYLLSKLLAKTYDWLFA
ncbi:hypothetical protein JQ629_32445 [Bradyrhizobium sp. AUGA SZCCT0222]|uniref:hypothetical protein n=1 Tax=Bradyrhizobium sp. AUGA SZCCT0222 TaxID=2807668 RepID=UPI001BA87CA2|nr:hypothetical protein [Bradyrhizobium sp. AUGA SZCCT0222]MBR1272193.1 hypothetical protein [Bradyrhizobium sp. AUGA SZCCT0222]